jgi:CelD/BcsL family acetyltransferase involved in cellulose biosynthesis
MFEKSPYTARAADSGVNTPSLRPLRPTAVIVRSYDNFADLEPWRPQWDALADDCVFRSWNWLAAWWRHYGGGSRQLRVIAAFVGGEGVAPALAGALPCYVESSWARGRVVRLLGDGEACSDHAGLLAAPAHATAAAAAVADHLALADDWDLVELTAVDDDDAPTLQLHAALGERGCIVVRTQGDPTWAIDLPATWDEFLALQSKSHRKQLRQAERRVLDAGDARWRLVDSTADFDEAWTTLVDLHQRRRRSLDEPGCFASPTWAAFHRDVARRLLEAGQLRLSTLWLGRKPAAAEYHFAGRKTTFAYQGGVDPERLADEPGRLSTIRAIQQAIAEGHARFDLLRGDEPYKAHWRAVPRGAWELLAVPPRGWPQVRHSAWQGLRDLRRFARQLAARHT